MAKKTAAKKGAATSRATKGSSRSTKPASAARSKAPRTKTAAKTAAKPARKPARKPAARSTPRAAKPAVETHRVGDLPPNQRSAPRSAPAAPVPPTGKKVSSGLSKKDLAHFRELLLEKRRELVGDMSSMEREALRTSGGSNLSTLPIHMADQGTDNYEQEFTLGLVEKDRVLLREINHALAKIQAGTYGICEGTGLPINRPRLEAQPWARHSIEYARQMEKRGVR